ncbi:hypothetical protein A2671_01100 [Candidatus Kaiserbacteria bacterium RIFCSPHIGHO2_01_FULL_49_13]|uniref:Damage-inducible protein J n=1 Tax=Candidatus Kaiserbacteria bacterium RIFCSPHIGHO2_01_FULL_49_13 TaxID=1798477 RepID=A0A1F6CEH0_9BACT|nr:MAG: hypothetical protein A2671_01100 [Candidatus Kaiserbacteria bacterium RIFCSPHIGHO2_01_FULL_49_13]
MNTALNVRTNKSLLNKAKKVFSAMGMSTSTGVNMFLHRVVAERALPFTPADPKIIRKRWDRQTTIAIKTGKRFKSAGALHKSISK